MSNWKTYKLGDLINVKHGFAFKGEFFSDEPTNSILLTPGNFKIGGGFKGDKFKYYKGDYPEDYILKEGDIIITMTDLSKAGDTLGYSAKIPNHTGIHYLHNQRLGLVQFKNKEFDHDYLYWVLRTKPYQSYIVGSATGSTVKHTSPSRISDYEFLAPENIKTQQQIASILSSLDSKIELNLQMNQTIEATAQAIFKEWFVNFNFPGFDGKLVDGLPKGWRIDELGITSTLIAGGDKPKIVSKEMTNIISVPIYSNGVTNEGLYGYTDKPRIIEESITISARGTIGFVCLRMQPYVPIVRLLSLIPKKDVLTSKYLFLWFKNQNISGTGTTQQQLTVPDLSRFKILVPEFNVVSAFTTIMDSFYEKIEENKNHIKSISQIRDRLLPKLMSGKIEIKESINLK